MKIITTLSFLLVAFGFIWMGEVRGADLKFDPKLTIPRTGTLKAPPLPSYCAPGWRMIADNSTTLCSEALRPGTRYISNGLSYTPFPCSSRALDPADPRYDPRCVGTLWKVTGGYTCRLDDFPADDACPEGWYLSRTTMDAYACNKEGGVSEEENASFRCIEGFYRPATYTVGFCLRDGISTGATRVDACISAEDLTVESGPLPGGTSDFIDECCAYLQPISIIRLPLDIRRQIIPGLPEGTTLPPIQ